MGERIDWTAVRERLAAAEAASGRRELTDAQREAIFAERAAALATPLAGSDRGEEIEGLVFALGREHYAFASAQVREVRPLDEIVPLPGTPPFVVGLINVRGRVVPVLDLRPIFGLPESGEGDRTVLLLASPRGDVGVLTTSRPAVRWLPRAELRHLSTGAPPGLDPAFVRGVSPDLVVLLDAERLLADPRLRVEQE